jgi:hypothetical protein
MTMSGVDELRPHEQANGEEREVLDVVHSLVPEGVVRRRSTAQVARAIALARAKPFRGGLAARSGADRTRARGLGSARSSFSFGRRRDSFHEHSRSSAQHLETVKGLTIP